MHLRTWLTTMAVISGLAAASGVEAGQIGLQWSPAPGASGYRVHLGPSPGTYTSTIDVGNSTETVLSTVPNCADSYYAVTAYNAAGESDYSNEVRSWPYPEISSLTPTEVEQGSQFTMTFRGMNFDPSREWEVVFDPDPCVEDPAAPGGLDCPMYYDPNDLVVTCDRVELVPSVEPLAPGVRPAPTGTYRMTLRSADGAQQAPTRNFVVDVNALRANVNTESSPATELRLDGADLASLLRLYNQCDPLVVGSSCSGADDDNYDPDFDFDGDGRIDGSDLAEMMGARWGGCWNGSSWTAAACPQWLR